MRIRKPKQQRPFTIIDNAVFRENRLSAKAKGILCHLLSLPDDWQLYADELQQHFTDGRDSIRSGLQELIKAGYLVRGPRTRDDRGQLRGYDYEIYETPQNQQNQQNQQLNSYDGFSYVGKPDNTKYLLDKAPTTDSEPPGKLNITNLIPWSEIERRQERYDEIRRKMMNSLIGEENETKTTR